MCRDNGPDLHVELQLNSLRWPAVGALNGHHLVPCLAAGCSIGL